MASIDIESPITLEGLDRKFNERFDKLEQKMEIYQKQFDEDKKKAEDDRKKIEDDKKKAEDDRIAETKRADDEREMVWKEWDAGNFSKWARLYYSVYGGDGGIFSSCYSHLKSE